MDCHKLRRLLKKEEGPKLDFKQNMIYPLKAGKKSSPKTLLP